MKALVGFFLLVSVFLAGALMYLTADWVEQREKVGSLLAQVADLKLRNAAQAKDQNKFKGFDERGISDAQHLYPMPELAL